MYNEMNKKKDKSQLKKAFNKHFKRSDEDDSKMEEDMESENDMQMKPMTLYQKRNDRRVSLNKDYDEDNTEPHSQIYGADGNPTDENRMYGENAESNDEGYDSVSPEDDDEYEKDQKDEIEEDSQPMLPKAQRKRMSIAVLTKKMSKPKKSA